LLLLWLPVSVTWFLVQHCLLRTESVTDRMSVIFYKFRDMLYLSMVYMRVWRVMLGSTIIIWACNINFYVYLSSYFKECVHWDLTFCDFDCVRTNIVFIDNKKKCPHSFVSIAWPFLYWILFQIWRLNDWLILLI